MKSKSIFLLSAIVLCISCLSRKNDSIRNSDPIISYLDSINSSINLDEDSIGFFSVYRADTSEYLRYPSYIKDMEDKQYWGIIGTFIDSSNIHALVVNSNDSTINFYNKLNNIWKKIGSDKVDVENILGVGFIDMNGDNKNEIISYTHPNMNGNIWPSVYTTSTDGDSIKYAGQFETEFLIKKNQQRLETDYGGSWWMPIVRTIYTWRNDKLIPIKRIQIALKDADMIHDDKTIEYLENPTYDQDSLKSIFLRDYTIKDQSLFDNFFENN